MNKIIICLALIALVASQSTSSSQSGSSNQSNQSNQSNSISSSNFDQETFSLVGNWTVLNSDCEDFENCTPMINVTQNSSNHSQIIITLTYPNTTMCDPGLAGITVVADEEVALG